MRVVTLADAEAGPSTRYPIHRVSRTSRPGLRQARTVATIARAAARSDVVLATGLWFEAALGALAGRTPFVAKVVGDLAWERATNQGLVASSITDFQQERGSWRVRLLKAYAHWPLRRARRVIVPSRFLAGLTRSFGVAAERVRVVPNAPPPARAEAGGGERSGLLTVTRLTRWKGVEGILEALAQVDGPRLTVAGDGPLRRVLEERAHALGVADRVDFLGVVPSGEVEELLRRSEAFVLNSTYEGMPHVVLEAWQADVPVVASAAGGTPELVEDGVTGLLVAPEAPGELAEALGRLTAAPELRERLVSGGRIALRGYTPDRTFRETRAVLAEAAAGD